MDAAALRTRWPTCRAATRVCGPCFSASDGEPRQRILDVAEPALVRLAVAAADDVANAVADAVDAACRHVFDSPPNRRCAPG